MCRSTQVRGIGSVETPKKENPLRSPRPIIIDTDAGWDDWLALLFPIAHRRILQCEAAAPADGIRDINPVDDERR